MDDWNFIKATDSYKVSHWKCYPKDIEKVYSYLESRGGQFPSTIFFGLQYYLKKYLEGKQITKEKIDEAEIFWNSHMGRNDCFNRDMWEHVLNNHDGYLPLFIEAVPEGTEVPVSNCLMTITNNGGPKCAPLVNYAETLLMKIWYSITIATQSFYIRKGIIEHLIESGTPDLINFKVQDFGYRGVSCEEQAGIGAAAHLISFMGTDTVAGIDLLQKYYSATDMCGFSIPATEHSIICSFGEDNEIEACENFLDQYPEGLIACVSDSYDIYNACENIWGGILKEKVMKRNGTLVIRPDSGECIDVVPKILKILWDKFGGTLNDKGYKVLDSHVRVIQGDGMDISSIDELYDTIENWGWSSDNLTVGSGGGLLQKVDRDTCKFAIKCSAVLRSHVWIDVFKDPITDPGKKSKRGRFQTIKLPNGDINTVDYTYNKSFGKNLLVPVFENGKILKTYSLNEIKNNAYPK